MNGMLPPDSKMRLMSENSGIGCLDILSTSKITVKENLGLPQYLSSNESLPRKII